MLKITARGGSAGAATGSSLGVMLSEDVLKPNCNSRIVLAVLTLPNVLALRASVPGVSQLGWLKELKVSKRNFFVGDIEAQVLFAGLTPEFAGLYQINFIVPQGVVPGDAVPIRIVQGGVSSRNDVTLAVRVR